MTQAGSELISAVDTAIKRVRTRALDVSFNELLDMYETGELKISPEYQRLFRWSEEKQSQFIESLILELPIPPIYVMEIENGVYELIDGLQRLSSYFHFRGVEPTKETEEIETSEGEAHVSESLTLTGCDVLPELNNLTYNDLPMLFKIKLKRHFIRMQVLRRETEPEFRYHMFKRLNTGGEKLSDQEVRNCTIRILSNDFNDFLQEMSKDENFLVCVSNVTDKKVKEMYLEELVLRFFAMKNDRSKYIKNLDVFLTDYMESVSHPKSDVDFNYSEEKTTFKKTFEILSESLGVNAFSGFNASDNPGGYFSTLHFEAFTLGLQGVINDCYDSSGNVKEIVGETMLEIKKDTDFKVLTTGGGKNYSAALETRINFVAERLSQCLV